MKNIGKHLAEMKREELEKLIDKKVVSKIISLYNANPSFGKMLLDIYVDNRVKKNQWGVFTNRMMGVMFILTQAYYQEVDEKADRDVLMTNIMVAFDKICAQLFERIDRCAHEVDTNKEVKRGPTKH